MGSNVAGFTCHGAMSGMAKQGLLNETKKGVYVRVKLANEPVTINADKGLEVYEKAQDEPANVLNFKSAQELVVEAEVVSDPVDVCLSLISSMYYKLDRIKSEIETIQIAHMEEVDALKARLSKMEQLRALLKEVV